MIPGMDRFKTRKSNVQQYAPTPDEVGPNAFRQGRQDKPFLDMPQPDEEGGGRGPEEFVAGQDSPAGQSGRKKPSGLVYKILFGFLFMAALLGGALTLQLMEPEEAPRRPQETAREREIEALRQKEEAEKKLALAENRYNEAISQMDGMIARRVAEELAKSKPAAQGGAGADELAKQLKSISDMQEKLGNEVARLAEKKKEEELKPKEGSAAPTISFNMLPQIKKEKAEADAKAAEAAAKAEPAFDVRMGLQAGHLIPAKLDTSIYSSTLLEGYLVSATTTEPFEIEKGYTLPTGVKFLGTATPDMDSRRIIVKIGQLQYGSSVVKVDGMLLDGRGSPGLVTKYVDPLDRALLPIVLTSFASATAEALQDMTGYYNRIDGGYYERPDFDAGNAALQGTADTLETAANLIANSAARKKPVIFVKSGIPVNVQISSKLTMDKLVESGVVKPVKPKYGHLAGGL